MSPTELAVFASPALIDLWPQSSLRPDLLEVTTWMPLEEVGRYRPLIPDRPLLLYGGNLLGEPLDDEQEANLGQVVELIGAPWFSVRISLWPWKVLQEARRRGRRPSALDLGVHLEHFFARVRSLRERLGIPLLLENAPSLPGVEDDPESDPETIAAVLQATGCSFLLDLSYAQTAARSWGYDDARRYIERLPLDRLVEVHLSAPRRLGDGSLVDAHEPLREEDYHLLSWLLQRSTPRVVTLEYWKDSQELGEQVLRLREELGRS